MHEGWSPFSCTKVSLYGQVIMAFYVHALGLPITLGLNLYFLPSSKKPPRALQLLTLKNDLKGKNAASFSPHDELPDSSSYVCKYSVAPSSIGPNGRGVVGRNRRQVHSWREAEND